METVIMVSGRARAGKDSVAKELQKIISQPSTMLAFATPLKKIATMVLNWNGEKDELGRKILIFTGQYLGDELRCVKTRSFSTMKDVYSWNVKLFDNDQFWIECKSKLDSFFTPRKDFWTSILLNGIRDDNLIIISDLRMLKEYYAMSLNRRVIAIRVNRDVELIQSREETELENNIGIFDYVIDNNGSLEELNKEVLNMYYNMKLKFGDENGNL